MAAFTPTEFKDRASPAFDAVDDADVQTYLDMAACYVSEKNWGACRYPHGIYYLTAHLLTYEEILKAANGATGDNLSGGVSAIGAGVVKSEKIKSWSASYEVSSDAFTQEAFGLTAWGRQFMTLRGLVFSERCI